MKLRIAERKSKMKNAYTEAGVDVHAGYEAVDRIKKYMEKTKQPNILQTLGGFGGCFDLSQYNFKEPVLVSGTDCVGTKLMIANQMNQHQTIGIDCVAMCVNDILVQGAKPLYFLDYIAIGKNNPAKIEKIVSGIAEGCLQSEMALIGGETAEMPGMYSENDYDLAGFAVGIAEKKQLITGENIKSGDLLIGLPSTGIHSNGYSLVRKIVNSQQFALHQSLSEYTDQSLEKILLTPTKIYVKALMPLIQKELIKGAAHITGGGFIENIPRMLPKEVMAVIHTQSWPLLPIFQCLKQVGSLSEKECYEIFNMGIGMVFAISPNDLTEVQSLLKMLHEPNYLIGEVVIKNKKQQSILIQGATK